MELVHSRNKKIEKFLNRSYIELNNIQSYIPDGEIDGDKITKWTTYKLNKNLTKVTKWNKGFLEGDVLDENKNLIENYKFHIKMIPILDTFYIMRNGYPKNRSNIWLPCDIFKINNLCEKLYATNNSTYVDVKCSILLGKLYESDITPHFNSVIGLYSGIVKEYKEDFTQEFPEYKNKKWFSKAINSKRIRIEHDSYQDIKNIDSISECNLDEYVNNKINVSIREEDKEDDEDQKTIIHDTVPVQCIIMDRIDETFLDLVNDEIKRCRYSIFPKLTEIRKKYSSKSYPVGCSKYVLDYLSLIKN